LLALPPDERDEVLTAELSAFVRGQSQAAQLGERLVGSTEVLESVFGKWKMLEHQESLSGVTSLILSLGSLVGQWPLSRIKAALEATPVKHVVNWCREHLPPTVQSQRRQPFPTPPRKQILPDNPRTPIPTLHRPADRSRNECPL